MQNLTLTELITNTGLVDNHTHPAQIKVAVKVGKGVYTDSPSVPAYNYVPDKGRDLLDDLFGQTTDLAAFMADYVDLVTTPCWVITPRGTLLRHTDAPCRLEDGVWKWLVFLELDITEFLKTRSQDALGRFADVGFAGRADAAQQKAELFAHLGLV